MITKRLNISCFKCGAVGTIEILADTKEVLYEAKRLLSDFQKYHCNKKLLSPSVSPAKRLSLN